MPDPPTLARTARAAFAAVAVCVGATLAPAQQPASRPEAASSATASAPGEAPSQRPDAPVTTTFGILRPEDGGVAPLPAGTTYDDFLAWIAARRGPGYGINSIAIEARPVDDTRYELDVEVRLVVHRDGEWVRVPLGLDEATLTAVEHVGGGVASFSRAAAETGHSWSFDSAGEHTLRLTMLIPVTARPDESRLALTTPADAAVTTARVTLPPEAEATAETGIVRSAVVSDDATRVDWVGPGGRVGLAWRPKPVAAAPQDLKAETQIEPSVNGKSVQLRVAQKVSAARGVISSLTVRIPDGYALVDVSGNLYRSRREQSDADGRLVTVLLSEPTTNPVALTWTLTRPLPDGGVFEIRGFGLPGVPDAAQSGRVVIGPSDGFRFQPQPGATGVESIAMTDPESVPVSAGYEFRQPFRLDLKAEPVAPEYSVNRRLVAAVAADRIELAGELTAELTKGEIRELEVLPPAQAWTEAGWSGPAVRGTNLTEAKRPGEAAGIGVKVTNPAPRMTVSIKSSFAGDVTAAPARLPLPRLRGASPSEVVTDGPTVLCFRHPDGLAVRPSSETGTVRALPESAAADLGLPPPQTGERWSVFEASSEAADLSLAVARLPLSITADVRASVRPQGDGLAVSQRIDFVVRHGTAAQVRLRIPARASGVRITDPNKRLLWPSKTAAETAAGVVSIDLPPDTTGDVALFADYHVRRGSDADGSSLPLVRPDGTDVRSTTLRVTPPAGQTPAVPDPSWKKGASDDSRGETVWTTVGAAEAVPLRFSPDPSGAPRDPAVSRVLLRTHVDREGTIVTVADCRIDRPGPFLSVYLEQGIDSAKFFWRGRTVPRKTIPGSSGRGVELDLGPGAASGVLRIELPRRVVGPAGFAERIAVPTFRFSGGTTADQAETLWQVALPEFQHLFTAPGDYVPRFHWTLSRGLWTRQPTPSFRDVESWLGTDLPDLAPEFESGHRYAFSRLGPPQPLSFTVIARSLVVLIGAGTAIVVGYLFAHSLVPYRRAASASLAGLLLLLWAYFPDQIQIFLQPAAFGLLLVSVAAVAERAMRKRQERYAALNASTSAVDFVTILPGETSTSTPPASIGSEEPTVLRPGRPPAPEPVAARSDGPR